MKLDLTLEQQANIAIFNNEVDRMSEAQAKQMLRDAIRLIALKDNAIKSLISNAAGVKQW